MSRPLSQVDLLYTKLHPPPVREKQVDRRHLLEKLDAALNQRLTLICAPAGYGKTSLLSQWFNHWEKPVGWVTLDHSDNDLVQFVRYFLAALQQVEPKVGKPIQDMLPALQPMSGTAAWMLLVNEIAESEREFVVILDDYHEVEDRAVHEALDHFIEHMPDNLHLILATRADPPLSLPRLRARGQLTELRLSDLRFNAQEVTEFLNIVMRLNLTAEDAKALEAKTEGWIGALQMAALSLQERRLDPTSRSEFVREFTGSHRFILDYLVEEVLKHQPPNLQEFLLKTSILKRLCGSLCDAINGRIDGQNVLERLEAANLFIIPLDDERLWYRYHHLFSDLLHKHLLKTFPDHMPDLHRRASLWHEKQGLMDEAIDHALAGYDFERAAALIEDGVEATLMRSEVKTFLSWMERLPEEYVRPRPRLSFFHTWALLMSGQSLEMVERRMQSLAGAEGTAENAGVMAGRMAALRAYLKLFQADFHLADELCRQALENLPENDLFLRSIITWILSMIHLSDGELPDGRHSLAKVIRLGREIGNPLIAVTALSHQARLHMRQGRLQLAHETLEQALRLATGPQGRLPVASEALIVLGELEREWNHLEQAGEYLTASIELARQWNELASFDAYFPLMRLRLAQGDLAAAREAIETAWQMAQRSDFSQIDDILADLQRGYFIVMQGNAAEAIRWAEQCGLAHGVTSDYGPALDERQDYINSHLRKYQQIVLARLLILQGQATEALDLLETLLALSRQLGRIDLMIEVQILRALAFQCTGDSIQAMEALAEALSQAEPGGYIRIFLDEGEPMICLLRQAASQGIATAYTAKLLAASGEPKTMEIEAKPSQAQPLIEPLSERELEVLRLLAASMSNREIADKLVVAVSTVHSHCKSIYGKLDVHARSGAVQRARELGLI